MKNAAKRISHLAAATAMLMALGGFDGSLDDYLVGHWACEAEAQGVKVPVHGEYKKDGTLVASSITQTQGQGPNGELVVVKTAIELHGTWSTDGMVLTEEITDLKLLSYEVNGQKPADISPIEALFREKTVGKIEVGDVEIVDDSKYREIVRSERGTIGTCTRM